MAPDRPRPRQPHKRRPFRSLLAGLVLILTGCAHFPVNAPLLTQSDTAGYRLGNHVSPNSDELLLALSFSGGGTRAAAMAYGVLEALRDTEAGPDGQRRRLLDEIDVISSVSGGAITSTYYALYGEKIFEDFESRFLKDAFQRRVTRWILAPRNWIRLMAPHFRRTDLLAERLDQQLFDGKTFADLQASPFLIINATDIVQGSRFDFTQDRFDLLCSDLDAFPLSRAVAASAAVPVVLPPITLQNYGWTLCDYQGPASQPAPYSRRLDDLRSYRQASKRAYIHLFDGGLVDNLGILGLLEHVFSTERPCETLELLNLQRLRHVAVIIVNAVTDLDRTADRTKQGPGLAQTIWAAANIPIDRTTVRSVDSLQEKLETWSEQIIACRQIEDDPGITIYPIRIYFNKIQDPALRLQLSQLPTTLTLDPAIVDKLRQTAGDILLEDYYFQQLLDAQRQD